MSDSADEKQYIQKLLDALFAAIRNDSEEATGEALQRVWVKLYDRLVVFARTYVRDEDAAHDCVNDYFEKLPTVVGSGTQSHLELAYFYKGVMFECLHFLLKERTRRKRERSLDPQNDAVTGAQVRQINPVDAHEDSIVETDHWAHLSELVRKTLEMLSPKDQEVLDMKMRGATFEEIGQRFGTSEDNARKTLFENGARKRFLIKWQLQGLDPPTL